MRDLTGLKGKHNSIKCYFGVLKVTQSLNPMKNSNLLLKYFVLALPIYTLKQKFEIIKRYKVDEWIR